MTSLRKPKRAARVTGGVPPNLRGHAQFPDRKTDATVRPSSARFAEFTLQAVLPTESARLVHSVDLAAVHGPPVR